MRLQRYVSDELTHFVGRARANDDERFALLCKIVRSGELRHKAPVNAGPMWNIAIDPQMPLCGNEMFNPSVICFCDIPPGDLGIHMSKYSRFGIAFANAFCVGKGASPVYYVATRALVRRLQGFPSAEAMSEAIKKVGGDIEQLTESTDRKTVFNAFASEYMEQWKRRKALMSDPEVPRKVRDLFMDEDHTAEGLFMHVFGYIKCFDPSVEEDDPNNFYMEREWRVADGMRFEMGDIRRIILPSGYAKQLRECLPEYFGQVTFADGSI